MKQRNVRVTGVVQGVGFRNFVHQHAMRLGVVGFVKNRDDGSVVAEAQGSAAQLEQFVEICRQGPRMSRVDEVQTEEVEPTELFETFEVHY